MKNISTLILFLSITTIAYAQKKEERKVDEFNSLSVRISANVYITKGNTYKVIVEGDEKDLEELQTEVDGDMLEISFETNSWWWNSKKHSRLNVYITMPELEEVKLSGSGIIKSDDTFVTNDFEANVSGSGRIELKIEAKDAEINISGSGKVILSGKSDEVDINISGSGDVDAENFRVAEADIKIMGSGDCTIYVTEKLDSKIMGSGDIRYAGNPKHVNNNSMGSGSIRKL